MLQRVGRILKQKTKEKNKLYAVICGAGHNISLLLSLLRFFAAQINIMLLALLP
jgi:hypothetical protein